MGVVIMLLRLATLVDRLKAVIDCTTPNIRAHHRMLYGLSITADFWWHLQ